MAHKFTRVMTKDDKIVFVTIHGRTVTVSGANAKREKTYKSEDTAIDKFGKIQDKLISKGYVEENKRNFF